MSGETIVVLGSAEIFDGGGGGQGAGGDAVVAEDLGEERIAGVGGVVPLVVVELGLSCGVFAGLAVEPGVEEDFAGEEGGGGLLGLDGDCGDCCYEEERKSEFGAVESHVDYCA
jgi:hypothetical protein